MDESGMKTFWQRILRKISRWIQCTVGQKPPRGTSPTVTQESTIESLFPNIKTWSVTGASVASYNCIAWSVCITDQWLWPGDTVADFDAFYASHGWNVSDNCNREYKKRKVDLYANNADPNDCTHGSREIHDCGWDESKLGGLERIYGDVLRCYEKQDDHANLDLCNQKGPTNHGE
jgi:hypothetical protein